MKQVLLRGLLPMTMVMILASACEKKEIQFATDLGETYTNLFETDTVAIAMSTFFKDSFPTNSLTEFMVGSYYDSIMGRVTAKPFMQFAFPAIEEMVNGAIYDSLCLVLKMNKTWYGDTSALMTFSVKELSVPVEYIYSGYIYNNTAFAEYSTPLGTRTMKMFPSSGDSVIIRLSDAKGNELMEKFRSQATEVATTDAFKSYFKGISIDGSSNNSNAMYTIPAGADSVYIRLHYHTNTPYHTAYTKDIKQSGADHSNYINTDRTGTIFQGKGITVSSVNTGNRSVSQAAAGALLKMTFPSLRNMLKTDPTLRLLKASLVLQVDPTTESGRYPLPSRLYLASTDATNLVGSFLSDTTGTSLLGSTFTKDEIYDYGSQYVFNITAYINKVIATAGSEETGLFLLQDEPGVVSDISRVVINNSLAGTKRSKLVLSFLTLNSQR